MTGEAPRDVVRTPGDHPHRRAGPGGGRASGGRHEDRDLAEHRPRAERREHRACLTTSTRPSRIAETPSAGSPSSNRVEPATASVSEVSASSWSRSSSTTSRNGHTARIPAGRSALKSVLRGVDGIPEIEPRTGEGSSTTTVAHPLLPSAACYRPLRVPIRTRAEELGRQEAGMGAVGSRFVERASWLLQLPLETPTIAYDDEQSGCTLWLKLDYLLPSGCTKDRMATNIVAHAIASGEVSRRRWSSRRPAGRPRSP